MPPRQRSGNPTPVRRADDPDRFRAGGHRVPELAGGVEGLADALGITFDVLRPRDLVMLSVRAVDCDLVKLGRTVFLEAGEQALLVVAHPFQHALEEAQFEQHSPTTDKFGNQVNPADPPPPDPDPAQPTSPVGFRPARASRLVFSVPQGELIEFSSAGVLEAMTRLRLVVHPLATPGRPMVRGSVAGKPWRSRVTEWPFLHLGDGLIAELRDEDVVIRSPGARFLRANPPPDSSTPRGAAFHARELRRARELMAERSPVIAAGTRIPVDSEFRPGGGLVPAIEGIGRRRKGKSSPPSPLQTAIEAPFRLLISPSEHARWAHAADPVPHPEAPGHVELWHSRLAGPPPLTGRDAGAPDERSASSRTLRAIWARDRDTFSGDWTAPDEDGELPDGLDHADDPFLASLDRADRHMLVRQSAETWEGGVDPSPIEPVPFMADALWLSGLGAWLDLHGAWDTDPYSDQQLQSIMVWDHVAPLGRDQFVRVVYPGYLYPFGHQAALVKVTERKMKRARPSVASLYQRMFIVIGERSRSYDLARHRNFPFDRIDLRPLVTPPIDKPDPDKLDEFFWPSIGGQELGFVVDAWDREQRPVRMVTPLLWVSAAFSGDGVDDAYMSSPHRQVAAHGQSISFVPRHDAPDTDLHTEDVFLLGTAVQGDSTPRMSSARVAIPAVQRLSPQPASLPIRWFDTYLADGLVAKQRGAVWATTLAPGSTPEVTTGHVDPVLSDAPVMKFGQGADAGSDKAGGFLEPSLPLAALARDLGPIGDPVDIAAGAFDAQEFLQSATPKLFGLVDLWDLLPENALDEAPSFVTETLGRVASFLAELDRLARAAEHAVEQAKLMKERATAALEGIADQALGLAETLAEQCEQLLEDVTAQLSVGGALADLTAAEAQAELAPLFQRLSTIIGAARELADLLPPEARHLLHSVATALDHVSDLGEVLDEILAFVKALDPANLEVSFRYEWAPTLRDWPEDDPSIVFLTPTGGAKKNLVLRVVGRVTATGTTEVESIAEIRDLELRLFGKEPLMVMPVEHLFFRAGSAGKPEIDVVLGELEFRNELSFIETIKDLIPFDGFSDPPYLDVDTGGARAGFTLQLPSVAVGVFNLSNVSLGADLSIPFLGDVVTAGFDFCTREKPFSLTVMCLGGGGWFGVRMSPNGLDVLELGLEAQACLAIDFGVASGSISAAVGVYLRIESEAGSLTGYFRLRGEVDVLGLISASIELYMSLTYHSQTGKMVGRATITVEVDVLVFSGSVSISAERQLAGSNGDPSFREVLGAEDGTSPLWSTYCTAFAGE